MAQSKKSSSTKKSTSAKKTNSKTSTAKKSSTRKAPESAAPPPPPAPPIRREITALIFLFLAVFLIISHYNKDGSFIVFFANLIKGLIGWGFWVMVPAFVVAAVILGFHKGYPVALRAVCALLVPVFVSATGHLLTRNLPPAGFDVQLMVGYLFEHGQVMDGGGVLGGLIAIALGNSLSLYGALPVLAVILVFCIIKAFKFNVSGAVTKARERSHVKYDPSMYVVNKFSDKDEDIVEPVMLGNSTETVISKSSSRTAKQPRKIERIERDSYSMMDIPLFEEDEEEYLIELINPSIIMTEGEQDGAEGCLSVPGDFGMVKRPLRVRVRAQDRFGDWFEYEGEGLTARCFCHEIDHLEGVLFTSKCSRMLEPDEISQGDEE